MVLSSIIHSDVGRYMYAREPLPLCEKVIIKSRDFVIRPVSI